MNNYLTDPFKARKKANIVVDVWEVNIMHKMPSWADDAGCIFLDSNMLIVPTLEGVMNCYNGDFLIKGVKGELYPCRRDIFLETYEAVE